MPAITFLRKNMPFLTIFTALVVGLLTINTAFAQNSAKFDFHGLEENTKDLSSLDPLYNQRTKAPQRVKDLSEKSENKLKSLGENLTPSAGEIDSSFNSSIDLIAGTVRDSAIQTDGKLVATGFFKTVNGSRHNNIIRFNADNTIDETFLPSTNGTINTLAIQADGKILIAGVFTTVNGVTKNSLARLNADGSLDSSFDAGMGADNVIYDIAVQADGKIFVGGSFIGVNNYFSPKVVRLNANGSPDTTFASPIPTTVPGTFPSIVYSLALQTDGKIALGGAIVTSPISSVFKSIVRLNTDGTYDNSFNAGEIDSNLYKVALQPDGKFIIGGFFQTINGVSRPYLARLKSDGALDESFNAGTNASAPITSIHIKPDGKIIFGGIRSAGGLAKQINSDGTLDILFNAGGSFGTGVNTLALTAGGKVFVGGTLSFSFGTSSGAAFLFNADGSQDSTFIFSPTSASSVSATAVQPDGKILIGGTFDQVNGTARNRIARLNSNGTIDNTFVLGNGSGTVFLSSGFQVTTINLLPDGKILVGGTQISSGNLISSALVRLNQDGSYDESFVLPESLRTKTANTVTLRSDGKILFAYSGFNASREFTGGISRLNSDGSLDTTFNFTLTPIIESIVALPDGKVLAGGAFFFGSVNSQTGQSEFNYGLIRLNADGTLDGTFRAGFVTNEFGFTSVYSLALQTDGNILVGGRLFTGSSTMPFGVVRLSPSGAIDGTFQLNQLTSTTEIARVEKIKLLSNGKVLAGGRFNNLGGAANANIARLNSNGTIDTAFQTNTDNIVLDIAQQTDGKILIGGQFDLVNNTPHVYLARLLSEPTAPRRAKFDFDGDGKSDISLFRPSNAVWYLNNSTNGFSAAQWGISTDKLAPADYDGDGKTDIAIYRDGAWYLLRSSGGFASVQFGLSEDIPQPADFDGDGKAELAVYRPSTGVWYSLNLANNQVGTVQFGISEDKPVIGDYDGDGKTDLAVFRPSNGVWYILQSSAGFKGVQWGIASDKVIPADYDGDGKTDIAIYRDGVWYIQKSNDSGYLITQLGISTDLPTPADYDGDGKADIAVFRDGVWYILQTTSGVLITQFGQTNDKPVANSFVY